MTGSSCLLDSSVVIHAFRGNREVINRLDQISELFISLTAVGELYYGAYKANDVIKHVNLVNNFLKKCTVLETDIEVAQAYGKVKLAVIRKGKPIPENDLWIAAVAIRYGHSLFTTDKHFLEIDGLSLL